MKRDTKRIEQLLRNTRENRKLVRDELNAGSSMQHVYDELGGHEQFFATRLKELKEFNAVQDKQAEAEKAAADAATKAAAAKPQGPRAELLAKSPIELLEIVNGLNAEPARTNKIVLADKANKAAFVNAILLATGYSVSPEEAAEGAQLETVP